MMRMSRTFHVDYAHRIPCARGDRRGNIHGHTAEICFALVGPDDKMDLILERRIFGQIFENAVMPRLDHTLILQKDDDLADILDRFTKIVLLEKNPTTEFLAYSAGNWFNHGLRNFKRQGYLADEVELACVSMEDSRGIWVHVGFVDGEHLGI